MSFEINLPLSYSQAGLAWLRQNKRGATRMAFGFAAYQSTWGIVALMPSDMRFQTGIALIMPIVPKVVSYVHAWSMGRTVYRTMIENMRPLAHRIGMWVPTI